jgi:hypothetical protein
MWSSSHLVRTFLHACNTAHLEAGCAATFPLSAAHLLPSSCPAAYPLHHMPATQLTMRLVVLPWV